MLRHQENEDRNSLGQKRVQMDQSETVRRCPFAKVFRLARWGRVTSSVFNRQQALQKRLIDPFETKASTLTLSIYIPNLKVA